MSLQQQASSQRYVIDLTDGPVVDLTTASYYSNSRAELIEAANRLLWAVPERSARGGQPASALAGPSSYAAPVWTTRSNTHRRARRGRPMGIDLVTVLGITAVAAVVILLMGIAATALH
jgi:hypothetical protein